MITEAVGGPAAVTIIVTTYESDTLYTEACLEAAAKWKRPHHQLLAVTHDETPLLRAYLEARHADGLIDRLIYARQGHGHTRGYNLAVEYATGDVIINICNDIMIGPGLVDECVRQLRSDPQLGIIGWHWYSEGTCWSDGHITQYALRDTANPNLAATDLANIQQAPWYTGRLFEALGAPLWLQLCNTGFFAIRKEVLEIIGGGFARQYSHYWADDFLNYAVLDQGLDVRNFPERYRSREHFFEFQYDQTDVEDRRRHADELRYRSPVHDVTKYLNGGLSFEEEQYLYWLARGIPDGSVVTQVGVWRGASLIVMLDALADRRITFQVIDGFDLPGISGLSGQPPVSQAEFISHVQPHMGPRHQVYMTRANTLDLDRFPKSDLILIDAGHTRECITHDAGLAAECLTPSGIAIFHDYGQPSWPDVKPAVDAVFSGLEVHRTLAVYRRQQPERLEYLWPEERGR